MLARVALDLVLGLRAKKRWFTYQRTHEKQIGTPVPNISFLFFIRTASTEELREHVERVGIFMLATFVGLQTLLAMTVVYLSFLSSFSVNCCTQLLCQAYTYC
jgi:hypothetical protein